MDGRDYFFFTSFYSFTSKDPGSCDKYSYLSINYDQYLTERPLVEPGLTGLISLNVSGESFV